jgi:hypothetical protein
MGALLGCVWWASSCGNSRGFARRLTLAQPLGDVGQFAKCSLADRFDPIDRLEMERALMDLRGYQVAAPQLPDSVEPSAF